MWSRGEGGRVVLHNLSSQQVVTAMGKTWHPEHFVCTHCQEEIGSRNFFERDGQPYCEKDYHNLFSPRCYYCNGPILDVSSWRGIKGTGKVLQAWVLKTPPVGPGWKILFGDFYFAFALALKGKQLGPNSYTSERS